MKSAAYACYNNNLKIREESSSGGIFTLLAKQVLDNGGAVFAAVYDESLTVKHCMIENTEDLAKARGSKYVLSNMGDSIFRTRELAKSGRQVMFVGSPCQCAGLLASLKEERKNVLVVDFVCHGVPGIDVWKSYIKALKVRGTDPVAFNMRSKKTGWSRRKYCWEIKTSDGKVTYQKQYDNPYMKGFVRDLFLRSSCYKCTNKGFERKTDITLADFWGVWDLHPEMDDNMGTSLVVVHSEKGRDVFKHIGDKITLKEVSEEDATRYNKSMLVCASKSPNYDTFKANLDSGMDFINNIDICVKEPGIKQLAKRLLRKTQYLSLKIKNKV